MQTASSKQLQTSTINWAIVILLIWWCDLCAWSHQITSEWCSVQDELDEKLPKLLRELLLLLLLDRPNLGCLNILWGFMIFLTVLSGFKADSAAAPAAAPSPRPNKIYPCQSSMRGFDLFLKWRKDAALSCEGLDEYNICVSEDRRVL